jgi:DNA-binding transcriptional ArsR family regulator
MARPRAKSTRPSPAFKSDVLLEAPGAIRALAHPARLTIVDELYQGVERTASELAELTGLSPSAVSYHLRALERWGVVERAEGRADARERPWRAGGRTLSLVTDADSAAAADIIASGYLQQLQDQLRRWALIQRQESATWREVAGVRRSFLWLTEDEADGFSTELRAVVEKYVGDRDLASHPEQTRRVFCMLAIVPETVADARSARSG